MIVNAINKNCCSLDYIMNTGSFLTVWYMHPAGLTCNDTDHHSTSPNTAAVSTFIIIRMARKIITLPDVLDAIFNRLESL